MGGEYSTEASAEQNFSQNLISDISVEYLLNTTGTRYLRLFRHRGLESVLEGEITVTGISFVMKHKVARLSELFRWMKKKPKLEWTPPATEQPSDDDEMLPQFSPSSASTPENAEGNKDEN